MWNSPLSPSPAGFPPATLTPVGYAAIRWEQRQKKKDKLLGTENLLRKVARLIIGGSSRTRADWLACTTTTITARDTSSRLISNCRDAQLGYRGTTCLAFASALEASSCESFPPLWNLEANFSGDVGWVPDLSLGGDRPASPSVLFVAGLPGEDGRSAMFRSVWSTTLDLECFIW
ncbi:Uncharacterized protein HZ326_31092 [Fusarium oxysporum f. sp. albedinis]|nr:Uncharacterized protein HZ326_31092 [Fusarium oxysporum f. sp. albedinis]